MNNDVEYRPTLGSHVDRLADLPRLAAITMRTVDGEAASAQPRPLATTRPRRYLPHPKISPQPNVTHCLFKLASL